MGWSDDIQGVPGQVADNPPCLLAAGKPAKEGKDADDGNDDEEDQKDHTGCAHVCGESLCLNELESCRTKKCVCTKKEEGENQSL